MMENVHQPAVAGVFYPAHKNELARRVSSLLEQAAGEKVARPKALIVPHAGYVYSGAIAAKAYALLAPYRDVIKRVVMIGPSHRHAFWGIATHNADYFMTPLGEVVLDKPSIAMATINPAVQQLPGAFEHEHCLEVQLPFLQTVLGEFSLTPLLASNCQPEVVAQVLAALWGGEETLIVVSSDLSHFLPYQAAGEIDKKTADAIVALQPDEIAEEQACGRLGVKGLLLLAQQKHLQPQLIDLCNSGDTAGDKERVVGYGAFSFVE